MSALLTLGLLSVVWTAYELGRNAGVSSGRVRAWDQSGRPVRIIEVLEPEGMPRRRQRTV
jgi:hypothetical protein